jgi:agmatinase
MNRMAEVDKSGKNLQSATVVLAGIPFDQNSSFMKGAAMAPARIREVLQAGATNLCSETGIDLGTTEEFVDKGDIIIANAPGWIEEIENKIFYFLQNNIRVVSLGGDHAITYPILKAYGRQYKNLSIIQLDAHPDLYDEFDGNRYSHASPFARIMEEKLARRLVQIGIRTVNSHQSKQIERFGVEVIEMRNFVADKMLRFDDPVYVSIDLDVLDPAFAPGVSHHEPGGMSSRQLIEFLHKLEAPVVGADIVEYNPRRDPTDITAMVAVKLLKEIVGRMLEQTTNNHL